MAHNNIDLGENDYLQGLQQFVVSGNDNILNDSAYSSAVIAASGITATEPYTLYTNNLDISGSINFATGYTPNIYHNNLLGLQGGETNQYYHLDSDDYNFYSGHTILNGYWTSAQTISYVDSHSGMTVDLSPYYTSSQTNANFLSANTSYYTQVQANANFLSANTSYYTQVQANANFLSANTSYYTQVQANANFLSANTFIPSLTGYWTSAQTISYVNSQTSAETFGYWTSAQTISYVQSQITGISYNIVYTSYTAQTNDTLIVMSATTAQNIYLPLCSTCYGKTYNIKAIGANHIIVPSGSDLIDLQSSYTIQTAYVFGAPEITSTTSGWFIK